MKWIKWYIRNVVELLGIATIIILIWQGVELLIYKEIRPNHIDTIIALVMVFVIHDMYVKYIR